MMLIASFVILLYSICDLKNTCLTKELTMNLLLLQSKNLHTRGWVLSQYSLSILFDYFTQIDFSFHALHRANNVKVVIFGR